MSDNNQETEEQIFEAASRVFQQKGYAGARMQEIADEAEINKSMLHYYFRSKDKLFQKVYQREVSRFFPVIFSVLGAEASFDEKIEQLIDTYYSFLDDNPRIAQFIIYEMNQNPDRFRKFIKEKDIHPPKAFEKQIKEEVQAGRMDEVEPRQLLVSIVGIILFPFIAQTMVEALFEFDEQDFGAFLKKRKAFLTEFILNGINYKRP
ncbi:TetR/AcrR family transcriptional regulator [Fodinibius salsisoli]|uniref:TetR/AcrR family transcriptional regulator n=1 Tax=Fodinibius salsisoli TaxID=2820877 RepID=A0ABT3PPF6_9BACT|nr:TetR/AcrR family transcriptional regulator [Fodinibius salsisoli]MCW9707738.1 TetR/AcrR family transcriptional regulator [Fodinibius salsisoli]